MQKKESFLVVIYFQKYSKDEMYESSLFIHFNIFMSTKNFKKQL